MTTRDEALAQIAALAHEHAFTSADINRALEPPLQRSGIAMRLFGYLGGIFIFSGIAAYIGMFWAEMNSATRVLVTLGSGFAIFILAVVWARVPERRRAVAPLLLMAALLQPTGLFVLMHEYFPSSGDVHLAALLVFSLMALQQSLTLMSLRHPVLFCSALGFAALAIGTVFDMLHVKMELSAFVIGASLLMIANACKKGEWREAAEFWYSIGGISVLIGAFNFFWNTPFELLYLALACFMIYLSALARSTTLLAVSTLAMLSYISYFTVQHFMHSAGWPVALILLGCLFFAISAGALRVRKRIIAP